MAKINQLREEQEECETKLEKERDIWAAQMFELIAEEDDISNYILNYIKYQQLYYKSALEEVEDVLEHVHNLISKISQFTYSFLWLFHNPQVTLMLSFFYRGQQ